MRGKVPPKEVQEAAEAQARARRELEAVHMDRPKGEIDEATLLASRKLALAEQMYELSKRVFSPEGAQ